jgi:serine/threonine protein kinase
MNEKILLNNRYQLDERQGSGGMAMVYRAQDLMLERTVAIKLLRADFSKDPDFRERFRQEAKAAANLSHPNIVTVHDFGLDSGRLFIVMEFVPGTDLKTIIQQRGRFPIEEAIALMVQACAGLGYAHRAGLVHCDVKPQNMLVTPDRRLKVVDFGIARALSTIAPEEQADIVWGSPQYFSPEQAAGNAPSPASDVYSLGVILYEMLTGQLPFSAPGAEELARMHREVPPPSPRKINPDIPPKLEQIILKVLSKEPSARYRAADQLGRVLVTFSQQSPTVATIPAPGFPQPDSPSQDAEDNNAWQPIPAASPAAMPPLPSSKSQPIRQAAQPAHTAPRSTIQRRPPSAAAVENPLDIDWITWLLGLLALIAVGGLIPFCIWVYYVIYPPF